VDKELKAKWVAALRSGEYRQAKNRLKDESGAMCCLGVLRVVAGNPDEGSDDQTALSPTQRERYGLKQSDAVECACKNDDGESFVEIASYIEANL
jgi:hypothetical protein